MTVYNPRLIRLDDTITYVLRSLGQHGKMISHVFAIKAQSRGTCGAILPPVELH